MATALSIFAPASDAPASRFNSFRIFAVMWAATALAHPASYGTELVAAELLLFIFAFIVIFRPSFWPAFIALDLVQVTYAFEQLPYISNHYVFTTLANVTIIAGLLCLAASQRSFRIDPGELYQVFAPVLRIEVVLLYVFVVLHKLNTGYFNPEVSCAAVMYSRLASRYPIFPTADWAKLAAIYGSLVIEAAILVLLISRRFWLAGILIGAAFHTMLTFDPGDVFFNFTSMLFAMYFLFTPQAFTDAVLKALAPVRQAWLNITAQPGWGTAARVAVYGLIPAAIFLVMFRRDIPLGLTREHARVVWIVYMLCVVAITVAALRQMSLLEPPEKRYFSVRYAVLAIFPVLIFLNGMMPYLGLKTETSFAMFSNLRTEGGVTNHLFMPTSLQLFDYQRDLVKVLDTNLVPMRRAAEAGWLWTYFEFQRELSRVPQARVTYERGGKVVTLARAADDPELVTPPPMLLGKFLQFRRVADSLDERPCDH